MKLSAMSDGSRRSSSSAFQAIGPATENARQPSVLRRCQGTTRWWRLEDRIRWRLATSDVGWQQFTRYWGALPWRHRELSLRAYGGLAAEHRASAARSGADVSSLGRTSQYYRRHGKRCNLSVMVLGDLVNTVLQPSIRDVMKAAQRVFADSASSDRRILRIWRSHDELIVPTCFTGLRSDEMVTPSKRTWSLAVIISSPSRSGGLLLPSKVEPYLEPAQRRLSWVCLLPSKSSAGRHVLRWHHRYSCASSE